MGIFAVLNLRKEAFPPVDYDIVIITTIYPGAPTEAVRSTYLEDDRVSDLATCSSPDAIVDSEGAPVDLSSVDFVVNSELGRCALGSSLSLIVQSPSDLGADS